MRKEIEMLEHHAHLLAVEVNVQLLSVISTWLKRICPPVGTSSRLRQRRNVDLPEPDGPMTTTTSPFLISTETPSSALMAGRAR